MLRANKSLTPNVYCSAVIKLQSKLTFVNANERNFRMRFIYVIYIKSKHDVFSDGTEQECLCFSRIFLGWYNLSPKSLPFHCNTVGYE